MKPLEWNTQVQLRLRMRERNRRAQISDKRNSTRSPLRDDVSDAKINFVINKAIQLQL